MVALQPSSSGCAGLENPQNAEAIECPKGVAGFRPDKHALVPNNTALPEPIDLPVGCDTNHSNLCD